MTQVDHPSTVVVGCAGGYINYRLGFNHKTNKIMVEESIHNMDEPNIMNWHEMDEYDNPAAAWEDVGKKCGWLS